MNMQIDPTTATRLLEATRRAQPLVAPMLSLIERFLREGDIDAKSLKQAARATYVKACEVVADAGLGNPAAGPEVHRDERAGA